MYIYKWYTISESSWAMPATARALVAVPWLQDIYMLIEG